MKTNYPNISKIRALILAVFLPRTYPNISKTRLWLFAMLARFLARTGKMVVVVGKIGVGSSALCEYATPGKVLCFRNEAMQGKPHELKNTDIPQGVLTLNEPMALEQASLLDVIRQRAIKRQGFILAVQSVHQCSNLYQEWLRNDKNKIVELEISINNGVTRVNTRWNCSEKSK